ncbi:hypothetical protein N9N67_00210 [Bacteriovoracaceae bacterium]|nr:hypothetical protein [Bacteriovoracaceae bacterium]
MTIKIITLMIALTTLFTVNADTIYFCNGSQQGGCIEGVDYTGDFGEDCMAVDVSTCDDFFSKLTPW